MEGWTVREEGRGEEDKVERMEKGARKGGRRAGMEVGEMADRKEKEGRER